MHTYTLRWSLKFTRIYKIVLSTFTIFMKFVSDHSLYEKPAVHACFGLLCMSTGSDQVQNLHAALIFCCLHLLFLWTFLRSLLLWETSRACKFWDSVHECTLRSSSKLVCSVNILSSPFAIFMKFVSDHSFYEEQTMHACFGIHCMHARSNQAQINSGHYVCLAALLLRIRGQWM